jgi:RHH-type transcriptional regulator, rel operon repressor / antitoxin RelB
MDARPGGLAGTVRVFSLEDLEDARLGAAALERFRSGKERAYSLDEVMAELGLDSSDL